MTRGRGKPFPYAGHLALQRGEAGRSLPLEERSRNHTSWFGRLMKLSQHVDPHQLGCLSSLRRPAVPFGLCFKFVSFSCH